MFIIQAFLLAITANLACGRVWSPITWPFCYPLINGTIVGIILGDPLTGLLAAAWVKPQCVRCLGCIHRCPTKAIHWKRADEDRGRYYNPRVEPYRPLT